ncbi:phosphonate metabolism protein/1,5-bisphosphokinase (PRPP-forming) PhnN [Paracoccus suum]|uniref:Ribose 1,5-bisphosphate phosphokinase PhnN n=1 Tax=Paracoccus suum TaxID=2259340 RepID=A0A344PH28_9RHOB|nr:phosphonate metabolism protein/1,5-bisphosphokinase (PRPP-forming) PhnN [Paracoccus suum]AXC48683.1 phosphonate metabolism protein/1,5-bisphosphokinase (PRPP-forming) PhnN [Paracoccus suum]
MDQAAARAFALVGPSGAGKDTLLAVAKAARPDLLLARRVITRPSEAGGEDFEGVSNAEFDARRPEFALTWAAHGLRYAIPASLRAAQCAGRTVIFNGSRGMLAEAARAFAPLSVIALEAAPEVLAARLAARGREDAADIRARLARADLSLPELPGVPVHRIDNSGDLGAAVAALLAVLDRGR